MVVYWESINLKNNESNATKERMANEKELVFTCIDSRNDA